MSEGTGVPRVERPTFFDGQRLTARDLAEVQRTERELRWLHNRSLHDWGVALGLEVVGERDARSVTVRPGYALDSLGRELLLMDAADHPIPAVAGADDGGPRTYFLTASYADDADVAPEMREGSCDTSGAVRRRERARIRWQDPTNLDDPAARYRRGLDVVLAAARVRDCKLAARVSAAERRDALPATQPFLAAGRTRPGDTDWRYWSGAGQFGVETTVVTAEAGFRGTPHYQAHVVGERLYESGAGSLLIDGTTHVVAPASSSFVLRMLLPHGATVGSANVTTVLESDYRIVIAHILNAVAAMPGNLIPAPSAAIVDAVTDFVKSRRGKRLAVGKKLTLSIAAPITGYPLFSLGYVVTAADVGAGLEAVATRAGTTLAELQQLNFASPNESWLEIGGGLKVPGAPVPLNPAAALDDHLLDAMRGELGWHVVWLGVEGGGA